MRIKISKTDNPRDYARVTPDFIYNRFELFCAEGGFEAVVIKNGGRSKVVEYRIDGSRAELGLWLTPITPEELEQLILYISQHHAGIELISYNNGILPYGSAKKHNHFRIVFPDTVEEMESRVSAKSRSKAMKKLRHAEKLYGKASIAEYEREDIPDKVVEDFFRFKLATRGRVYDMTPAEYLDRYHVSHAYVLTLGDTVGSIRFACEQCAVVYGENFSFNPELEDYSLGRYIFMHHLNRMVEKKHTELYFAGGDFEYKTHYGSIEETVYDCRIKLADVDLRAIADGQSSLTAAKKWLAEHLPPRVLSVLVRIKHRISG